MAKTITIPKEFGYPTADFWVEGIKYTYETGKAVLVDDKVAEIVSNAAALDPVEGKVGGNGIFVVNAVVGSNDTLTSVDKTYDEIVAALDVGKTVICNIDYNGSKVYYGQGRYVTANIVHNTAGRFVDIWVEGFASTTIYVIKITLGKTTKQIDVVKLTGTSA